MRSFERIDVGNEIVDFLLVRQDRRQEGHLRTVYVLGMGPARTLLEILQLGGEIPITHTLEPWRLGCLGPPSIGTVARAAGFIELLAVTRIGRDRVRRGSSRGHRGDHRRAHRGAGAVV